MRHSFIIIMLVVVAAGSNGQHNNLDFVSSKGKWDFPIDNIQNIDTMTVDCLGFPANSISLTLTTETSTEVKSIQSGTVRAIFEQYGIYTMLIKSGDYFLVYTGLAKPILCKGDMITKGTIIGHLVKDNTEDRYTLNLILMKGHKDININRWFDWNCAQPKYLQ